QVVCLPEKTDRLHETPKFSPCYDV
ncbi:uncharacterized protein METZ01_LOCUS515591, partial [marine metagenome]